MSWLLVDDRFGDHPKVEQLEAKGARVHADAVAAWLLMGADCKDRGTAGLITPERLAKCLHCWPSQMRKRAAAALVDVGLWVANGDGSWSIHDYDDYAVASERPDGETKPRGPKTQAERARDYRARRVAKGAARHGAVTERHVKRDGERDGLRDASRDGASRSAREVPNSSSDVVSDSDPVSVTRTRDAESDGARDAAPVTPSRVRRPDPCAQAFQPVRPSEFRERLALAWNAKHAECSAGKVRLGSDDQLIRAARGTPVRGHEHYADHFERLALWCESQPDPDVALERVLAGFYAGRWAISKEHPIGALSKNPQKYAGRVLPKADEYDDDAEERIAALGATDEQLELAARGRKERRTA